MRQVPVAAGAGDNMASTLGVGAAVPGDAVLTIGTSAVACAVAATFQPGPEVAILTSAHAAPETFLSMAVVMSATASLDWAARLGATDAVTLVAEAEAFTSNGRLNDAPVFLPCLTGIRTPLNRPDATARIEGLHPGVDRGMLGYATMEGVAFQLADCVAAQRALGVKPQRFAVVGGGSRSELWVRLIATAVGEPMELPARAHVSGPAGAARLAAVAAGAPLDTLSRKLAPLRTVEPDVRLGAVLIERKARFSSMLPAQR
jgi:xylulokinase